MDSTEFFALLAVILALFIGLPWLIFHYITQWKRAGSLTTEDENLMDELHDAARRLDDRLATIERIMTAENPGWRQVAADPARIGLEDRNIEDRQTGRRIER